MFSITIFPRLLFVILIFPFTICTQKNADHNEIDDNDAFVQVSNKDHHYFELSNGSPYIPIGFNLVDPPKEEDMEETVKKMAANKINYCRIWLGQTLWDIEQEKSGVYDEVKAQKLEEFLALAHRHGIRVKMCIEYFRDCPAEKRIWHDKTLHNAANGGPFNTMEEFLNSDKGVEQFKRKLKFYQELFGDHPAIFAWELWNEVNCVKGDWMTWTKTMLPELHRLFPKNMAVQSLGSFDYEGYREEMYRPVCLLESNDIAQVHRYLDLGARWKVCHDPVDVLAAEAVRELISYHAGKPIILAETGAVKPRHTGCSELYDLDTAGIITHDLIFAPFFTGSAGTGNAWWWKHSIQKMDLWYHFDRFAKAVEGIDPREESFKPIMVDDDRLRVYTLRGKSILLAWCRDSQNDWRTEFEEGKKPALLENLSLDLKTVLSDKNIKDIKAYDPWKDIWADVKVEGKSLVLPSFKRSLVLKIEIGS